MAARATGSATISFGLVSIPIKLFTAVSSSAGISFNMLHKKCGGRLKQQYICPKDDNEVVTREETVRGYEFSKDQYVIFSEDELKELQEKSTQEINITEFVPGDKVPAVYFEKSYYLGPDKGGDRAYKLLAEAMRTTGRSAIAKYAARGKQYLVLLSPLEDGLVMHQLYYSDEVRSFEDVPRGDAELKDGELQLAVQLVEQIASNTFNPEKYEDDVKKRIEEIIQKKIEGQEVTVSANEAPKAQIIDLMDALKASLGAGEPGSAKGEKAEKEKKSERKPAKQAAATAGTAAKKSRKSS